jgi:deoxycytidylate deaminase
MPAVINHRTFHVTFIVKKNKIQKIGINVNKTHPQNLKYDYVGREGIDIRGFVGIHSELSAIMKYGRDDCSDCTFVNVRIDKNGEVSMAMPCMGCQSLLNQVGYKRVFYTDRNGEFKLWHQK